MAGEASALVAELPAWLQWGANAALFVVTAVGGVWALRRGHGQGAEHEGEPFDPRAILEASPIRELVAAWGVVADNAKLQTEALKTIAAAAGVMARTIEQDWDERRIDREVERRLGEEKRRREAAPPP